MLNAGGEVCMYPHCFSAVNEAVPYPATGQPTP